LSLDEGGLADVNRCKQTIVQPTWKKKRKEKQQKKKKHSVKEVGDFLASSILSLAALWAAVILQKDCK
jgi:hypothetical protein